MDYIKSELTDLCTSLIEKQTQFPHESRKNLINNMIKIKTV